MSWFTKTADERLAYLRQLSEDAIVETSEKSYNAWYSLLQFKGDLRVVAMQRNAMRTVDLCRQFDQMMGVSHKSVNRTTTTAIIGAASITTPVSSSPIVDVFATPTKSSSSSSLQTNLVCFKSIELITDTFLHLEQIEAEVVVAAIQPAHAPAPVFKVSGRPIRTRKQAAPRAAPLRTAVN